MLHQIFDSIKESFGPDYLICEIDDGEHGVSEEDKKLNKMFYGN